MTTIYSPHNIKILLWCHLRAEPHPDLEQSAVRETIEAFLECDAVEPFGQDMWTTTAKGKAWVDALCNVPPPKRVYVDATGHILNSL